MDQENEEEQTILTKFYSQKHKQVIIIPMKILNDRKPKIVRIQMGDKSTKLKMAPEWFKCDNETRAIKNIVYPTDVESDNGKSTYNCLARYRAADNKLSNDFQKNPFDVKVNSCETIIVALENFAQHYGADLSFSAGDVSYQDAAHRAACGIANFSSAHLLATDYVSTAIFEFVVDLDYQTDLARSNETMQSFILSFANAVAEVLTCPSDYIRINSLSKPHRTRRETKIEFTVSTPKPTETQKFVEELRDKAKIGFKNHRVLKHVKLNEYDYKWKNLINFFQLSPTDFAHEFDIDYTLDMTAEDKRGNLPYYLPIGWYRHALKVIHKFPDDNLWLGSSNVDGEWAVAFHGTHGGAVKGIKEKGLLITKFDAMRKESVDQAGEYFDKPGLYVATHCTGGSHPQYTKPFSVPMANGVTEQFTVVFQCRVKPGAYTTHRSPVKTGEAWRFVDPDAIRPYGILVKNDKAENIYFQQHK